MDLAEIKAFLRVDGTDEDALIATLQLAAEVYITNTGVTKDYANALYELAVKLLIIHWFDNRAIETTGPNFRKVSFSLECMISSIKYNQPVVVVP